MKCLPASKLAEAKGVAIHDWHAEMLAIRTFNRFLLDECQSILDSNHVGPEAILKRNEERKEGDTRPFRVTDDVKLHMYCSEAPCKTFSCSFSSTWATMIHFLPDIPLTAST